MTNQSPASAGSNRQSSNKTNNIAARRGNPNNRRRVLQSSRPAGRKPATHNAGTHKPRSAQRPQGGRPNHHKDKDGYKSRGGNNNKGRRGGSRGGGSRRPPRKTAAPRTMPSQQQRHDNNVELPPLAPGDVRVIPVCGVEGIGTNMIAIEYGNDIVIIDAGFGFSTPALPGINYTVPNTTYLEKNVDRVRALVITHGHLDHVGGIPYVIDKLGFPPIYTREFGAMFIKKKLEEFPHLLKKTEIITVDQHADYLPLTPDLKVKFFGLTHSIPDSSGVIVQTPQGGIVSTGDVRVESENEDPIDEEKEQYEFFKDENILMLMMDSTNIERRGWSMSERDVYHNIDKIIQQTTGRLFIACFSSQVERLMQFMISAKKHGKYIAFEGRSIKSNMAIAEHLELTDFSHVIPINEIDNYPPHKVVALVTGSQGEQFAALNRISNGTHRNIKLNQNDTVVLSASIVPGNDFAVAQLKNNLYRGSYNVITYNDNQVHASGHGNREELKWIHRQIPYRFFTPVHGEPYMVRMHAKMAETELQVPKPNIAVPDNGSIIEIRDGGSKLVQLKEKIPATTMIVDGHMIMPLPEVVMRDRLQLSSDGMFVVVVAISARSGKLKKSPDLISRGFIYLRDNQVLLQNIRKLVQTTVEKHAEKSKQVNFDKLKDLISDNVSKHILQQTGKEPIVIPVVLSV